MKAVIPAAGAGTRLLPATKAQPKEMLPIVDTPVIQYVVEEAVLSGFKDILIITRKGKRVIEDYLDMSIYSKQNNKLTYLNSLLKDVRIYYTTQYEPLGLGHAILQAEQHVGNEPFAVLLGDDFYINTTKPATKQLLERYELLRTGIIGVETTSTQKVTQKGMVITKNFGGDAKKIVDLIEKPQLDKVTSNTVVSGRYILPPNIFEALHKTEPGYGGEIQLSDAIRHLILKEKIPFYAYEIKGKRLDIGDAFGYFKAFVDTALQREDMKAKVEKFLRSKFE